MTDSNAPEFAALKLLHIIASVEGKDILGHGGTTPDRNWVLETYAECLMVVRQPGDRDPRYKR